MIAVALFAAFSLSAQEPGRFRLVRPDSTRTGSFRLPDSLRVEMSVPDSLAHMSPWKTDFRTAAPMKVKPAVSMTSVVVIQKENLPSRVTVIDNNSLRLGSHFNLSNGQAWNWSPFPDAFLDARTLSFPMPREVGYADALRMPIQRGFAVIWSGYLSEYGRNAAAGVVVGRCDPS